MELKASILNSSDKVLMRFVAIGEGDVSTYRNLIGKSGLGSTYLDKLNKVYYQKMASEGKSSDWVNISGGTPTKMGVFALYSDEIALGRPIYTLQEKIEIGTDDVVRGTLKHVDNWEEFSSVESEQSGHYLALFIPHPEGTTEVKVKKDSDEDKVIDSDTIIILVKEGTKSFKIDITTSSGNLTRTLDLSKLNKE